jgi:hypothetical protein
MSTPTKHQVAQAIGWLDTMDTEVMEFDAADWSQVDATGNVVLEGRTGDGDLLEVVVQIVKVTTYPDGDMDLDDDYDEDEDDDDGGPL